MNDRTKKEISFLKVYSGVLTLALLGTIFYMMNHSKEKTFKEIDVERINMDSMRE